MAGHALITFSINSQTYSKIKVYTTLENFDATKKQDKNIRTVKILISSLDSFISSLWHCEYNTKSHQ